MGSKSKYATYIVPILQEIINKNNIEFYIEPFVGGANIIDKIQCKNKLGFDKSLSLIALHQIGQTNPELIPEHGNREWWDKAKDIYRRHEGDSKMEEEMELWQIGAIQFFGSYSRGGFSRGFAKNIKNIDFYNNAYKNFMEQVKSPLYKDIAFSCLDYKNLTASNALIYCDPPYQGTKSYGYKFETDFNYECYWNWVRNMSKENIVICSEQNFPDDFKIIWEKETRRTMDKTKTFKATEKLGTINDL